MNFRNFLQISLSLAAAALLAMMSIGCSGDDNGGPTGPDPTPTPNPTATYDELTIALNRVSVKYDCDFDPAGVTQPGDFRYSLNVDTLSEDKGSWIAITNNKEVSADINTGSYKDVNGQNASFRFPRLSGQSFRVRLSLREADPNGKNDFSSTKNITHIYSPAATQMYAPDGANYSSWSNATKVGNMSWNVNKRDRSWVLGVLTVEGCNATMNYSVTVREVI